MLEPYMCWHLNKNVVHLTQEINKKKCPKILHKKVPTNITQKVPTNITQKKCPQILHKKSAHKYYTQNSAHKEYLWFHIEHPT